MKVLWFANSPSLSKAHLTKSAITGLSWIEALEKYLQNQENIELAVAFHWQTPHVKDFAVENNTSRYYMLPKLPKTKSGRFVHRRIFAKIPTRANEKYYLEAVEHFRPDIIHFFGTEGPFPMIIPKLKVPSVIWFQGNLTVYQTKWRTEYPIWKTLMHEKITKILNGFSEMHDFHKYKKLVAREKTIFSHATNFTGRTDWDRRLVNVMAPKAKYYHCEEVLREAFYRITWKPHFNRKKFVIVTTIRPNPYKGVKAIFSTASHLFPIIDIDVEWRILGIGEDSPYVKRVNGIKKEIRTKLKFLGSKSENELAEELLNADVYVHPTYIDNSPNGVCEAMLLGMPVVATNVGGIPSLIQDNSEGLLVQSEDGYAMAGAILELYKDPDRAQELGENARKRGLKRNDGQKIAEELVKIYNRILADAG